MNVILRRFPSTNQGTFGALFIDNVPVCLTCEDPWNNNEHDISCIPLGIYQCQKYNSARFVNVWELQDVPGRTSILIHMGNTINDTHGCILVGYGFSVLNGLPSITDSVKTLNNLRAKLPDDFTLTIIG